MTPAPSPSHVWVDDPHAVVRRGMVATLAGEFTVVGESDRLAPTPDLDRAGVLVFHADGPVVGAALRMSSGRGTRLVATVRRPDDARLHELVAAGVAAIVFHDDLTPDLLLDTVRSAARNRANLPADVLPRLLERAGRVAPAAPGALTQREREVLRMLADGQDTRAIAAGLCYSERTVKNVVHDVLTKLNCRTRAQAVGLATRAGVI
jgi:DNA-binding NarL/FixJ family response regulator